MPTTRIKELAWQPRVRDVLAYLFYGFGSSAPSDGEGAGTANKGSLFVDYVSGIVYRNAGSRTTPYWLPLGAAENTKFLDDEDLRFGSGSNAADESVSDATLYYDSSEQRLTLDVARASATDPSYGTGLQIDLDDLFVATGARKCRGVTIEGDRESAVMGGDAHDMLLNVGYTNYAVNTPAGSYARGFTFQINNRTTGAISALQGGFIGVRQRSTGACPTLRGLQVDVKSDAGQLGPTTALENYRAEIDLGDSAAPAASYGFVADNRTDGALTPPTAAFKAINRGTGSCKGFEYGLDLMSAAGQATVNTGEIRLSMQDANNLPCVIFAGSAASDGDITTDVGADTLWADGSIYISVVDGAGKLFMKKADTWTEIS